MDHPLFGTNYGRLFQQCEPTNTVPPGTSWDSNLAGCTYGNLYSFLSNEQNSETGAAQAIYYANNPTGPNKTLGDEFYGSLWGFCPWTTGGGYCSSISTASNAAQSNLADSSIHAGKWYGFFAGMGMSHRWPTISGGGVQLANPPIPPTLLNGLIAFASSVIPSAGAANIVVTAPAEAQTMFACFGSPCEVTLDDPQGTHLYENLSGGGLVFSQTDSAIASAAAPNS